MPEFAANLSMMFTEVPFLDRFEAAATAGFKAVEYLFPYDFDRAEIRDRLERNGLTQALFNLPPGNWVSGDRGLAALADRRDEFRSSIIVALGYAEATQCPNLHVMAGIADRADPRSFATYRDALLMACDAAGSAGKNILIEPINRRDMPGYFLDDFDFAAELIDGLGQPNLRLQFDIYHRQILHGDVLRGLESLLPMIGHIQIAGVPMRHEPGSGELDDRRVLAHLDSLGYTGYVGCEYRPRAGTRQGLGWINALTQSKNAVAGLK